jgi:hypothetical protein
MTFMTVRTIVVKRHHRFAMGQIRDPVQGER